MATLLKERISLAAQRKPRQRFQTPCPVELQHPQWLLLGSSMFTPWFPHFSSTHVYSVGPPLFGHACLLDGSTTFQPRSEHTRDSPRKLPGGSFKLPFSRSVYLWTLKRREPKNSLSRMHPPLSPGSTD